MTGAFLNYKAVKMTCIQIFEDQFSMIDHFYFNFVPDTSNGLILRSIFAGGNYSFATCSPMQVPRQINVIQSLTARGVIIVLPQLFLHVN